MQEAIAKSVNATRRSRMAAPFRAFFGRTLDIALPTLCPACREPVGGNGLCAPCWSKLSLIEPPFCPRLGIPFAYDPGPGYYYGGGPAYYESGPVYYGGDSYIGPRPYHRCGGPYQSAQGGQGNISTCY